MLIVPAIQALIPEMTAWRHDFHAHPEIAYQEHRTSARIAELLASFGYSVSIGLAGTGVVGTLTGSGTRAIMLRADMDGLVLEEAPSSLTYRSQCPGQMHGCGHDGHMAMLLGAAKALAASQALGKATVHVLFQPAEEGDSGAKRLVDEGLFRRFPVDAVFGLHNWPGLALGKIAVKPGPVMASCDLIEIELTGKGAHAAMPHQGKDVVLAAAQLTVALQGLIARETDPLDSAVLSITQIEAGKTWNVMPGHAVLRGTLRALKPETHDRLERRIEEMVAGMASASGINCRLGYAQRHPPTVNSPQEAKLAALAAADVLGENGVRTDPRSSMVAEDFAYLLAERPGAYVWLGAEKAGAAGLHNPAFDFNDQALPIGASWWLRLVERFDSAL
jgi:hippurate hydrolase